MDQHPERVLNFLDALFAEPAPLQPHRVRAKYLNVARLHALGKGKHVLGDGCPASYIRMRSDADKLVHWAERAHHRPLFHRYVSGQRGAVYQHGVIADHRIMSHVRVSHDQRMAADAGYAASLSRASVERDAFTH